MPFVDAVTSVSIVSLVCNIDFYFNTFSSESSEYHRVKGDYCRFSKETWKDDRLLGLTVTELLFRRALSPKETLIFSDPRFSLESFKEYFDVSVLPRPLRDLLEMCYAPYTAPREIAERDSGLRELHSGRTARSQLILRELEQLFDSMGGACISYERPVYWTASMERRRQRLLVQHKREMAEKAAEGQHAARTRLLKHKRQIEFDMLPPEEQRKRLARRRARKIAIDNTHKRLQAIKQASFRHWYVTVI